MSQINNNNFFRWFTGSIIDDQSINLPRLGILDAKTYLPPLVSLEQTGFFINADVPFYDSDNLTDLSLRIINSTGAITNLGAILEKVTLSPGYRLYAQFTMPELPVGQYYYQIYNTATNTSKCISNYFAIISQAAADQHTVQVEWRNSRDAYYYNWSLVPDLTLMMRLHLSLANYNGEGTVDQTKAVSTGMRRNNNFDIDLPVKLSTYYFDDGANLACYPLFIASVLILNGKNYINKTLYLPNIRSTSKVAIGEIELYDQGYSRINKYGQLPQLVIKKGKYVLVNNSSQTFTISKYSFGNVYLGQVNVPSHTSAVVDISDLQINGYLNLTAGADTGFNALTAHTLPDGSYTYAQNNIAGVLPGNRVNQNDIYNNEYYVTISNGFAGNGSIINFSVDETYTPHIDANGLLRINTVDQPAILFTSTVQYNVNAGDAIRAFSYCEEGSSVPNAKIWIKVSENGGVLYNSSVSATAPNSQIYYDFVIDANAVYTIIAYSNQG